MSIIVKWRTLVVIVFFAEVLTLAAMFGVPALQGRVHSYPHFPGVIVFHDQPPACIVNFQGNFFAAVAISTVFWICVVFIVATLRRLIQNNNRRVDQAMARLHSRGL